MIQSNNIKQNFTRESSLLDLGQNAIITRYYHNCPTVITMGILAHICQTNHHPQKSGLQLVVQKIINDRRRGTVFTARKKFRGQLGLKTVEELLRIGPW